MDSRQRRAVAASPISRRQVLTLGAGVAVLGLTGCAPNANKSQQPAAGSVTFVSDQFQPVDEAEKMRKRILAGYKGKVNFISSPVGPFGDRIRAQARLARATSR